jgi:hypothetical protein
MRRVLKVSLASLLAVATLSVGMAPGVADAQSQQRRPGGGQTTADEERQDDRARRPRIAPLRRRVNAGPCPYVKILYDAARYVELTGEQVSSQNVAYTGEIEGLVSDCSYQYDEPIEVQTRVMFRLGRGPQATGEGRTYRYWIAVTERNRAVLEKVYFDLPVSFEDGERVTTVTQDQTIFIPRADATTSGDNFEILVGFDVTPAMAEFNRSGSRFRVNAGTDPQ